MTDHHTRHRPLFIKGRRTAERLKAAGLIALLFLAYGIVGTMDYEDAVGQEELYKEMVCAGHWPDYDDRRPDCSASKISTANH